MDLLRRAGMLKCKHAITPMSVTDRLSALDGDLLSTDDATEYRSLVGGLQYLTITRPDVSYAVNRVCQYLHAPRTTHFSAVKRILRYVSSTASYGLLLQSAPSWNFRLSLMRIGLVVLMIGDPRGDMQCSLVLT